MQAADVVSGLAENMAGSHILRVSAVNCAAHAELCAQHGVEGSSEIRVCGLLLLSSSAKLFSS